MPGPTRRWSRRPGSSAGFEPALTGYRFHPHPPLPGEIVSHGDLGPWNTVYRDGLPVAFIDWDGAQPVDPVADLASILPALQRSPLASAALVKYAPVDAAGAAASLEYHAGELRWIHRLVPDLARAL